MIEGTAVQTAVFFCFTGGVKANRLGISFGIIGQAEQIIDRNAVKIGKLYQNIRGNVYIPALIIAVYPLTARKHFRDLNLR